ncbi:unnamed protein product [Eretmochelys imbricata]
MRWMLAQARSLLCQREARGTLWMHLFLQGEAGALPQCCSRRRNGSIVSIQSFVCHPLSSQAALAHRRLPEPGVGCAPIRDKGVSARTLTLEWLLRICTGESSI